MRRRSARRLLGSSGFRVAGQTNEKGISDTLRDEPSRFVTAMLLLDRYTLSFDAVPGSVAHDRKPDQYTRGQLERQSLLYGRAARVAVNGVVDADGDITWTGPYNFTGGASGGPAIRVGYWSASTGGTYYGGFLLTGDQTFNAAGEYTVNSGAENSTFS